MRSPDLEFLSSIRFLFNLRILKNQYGKINQRKCMRIRKCTLLTLLALREQLSIVKLASKTAAVAAGHCARPRKSLLLDSGAVR